MLMDNGLLRIYFGTRDADNITRTSFIEVNPGNPQEIINISASPVMEVGVKGAFDEKGVMPACLIKEGGRIFMYYTGWSIPPEYPYSVNTGLAVSEDAGLTFTRISPEPVVNEGAGHISASQAFVVKGSSKWMMWYSSFIKWEEINGRQEPFYNLKYAESGDGISWNAAGITCLQNDSTADAYTNPYVWHESEVWKMLYSYRKSTGYRTDAGASYRIGYAESNDGISWVKKDSEAGIDVSPEGWDSGMIAYPDLYIEGGRKTLFYNGSGFGKSGFGYAVMEG
jgi:hypothetical protein